MYKNIIGMILTAGLFASTTVFAETTYVGTGNLDGSKPSVRATFNFDDFRIDNKKGGTGTLTIEKVEGRDSTAPTGTFPVTWKWMPGGATVVISIPEENANLKLESEQPTDDLTVFHCHDCNRSVVGINRLGVLPTIFTRQ